MARTRAYDRDALLRRSMELFWARGFAGVSIDDIVAASGVSRSSLYAAFPDKTALFSAVLEHYLDAVTRTNLERLGEGDSAAAAIRRFLLGLADQRASAGAPAHGCLLTNTAAELGAEPKAVARLVSGAFRRMEKALARRIEEARRQGDLSAGTDPRQFARQLVALIQGLRVMSRLGMEPRLLRDAVRSALAPLRDRSDGSHSRRKHGQGTTPHKRAATRRQHDGGRQMGAR
jgi:TetR/AcrR family transcriptional regulator, transcriptional repressor for nem operon